MKKSYFTVFWTNNLFIFKHFKYFLFNKIKNFYLLLLDQGNIINPEASISTNKNSDQLIIQNLKSKKNYIKSENEFLKSLINNPENIKPSNATFNSNFQNKLNIYSINSDYNSPHIIETDENAQILNMKAQEYYNIEVEKQINEINNNNNHEENQYGIFKNNNIFII